MHNDLMLFNFFLFFFSFFWTVDLGVSQQTIIYVKRGETVDLCDDRPTSIFAYEYRSSDGKRNSIVEPLKHERYSNPYQTSLLRITNVTENDSGLYKCPQDDTEWQKLQVYIPIQYVHLKNLHASTRVHGNELCGLENNNCLSMVEGEPLDVLCLADGYPRPAFDISIDKNGSKPTVMALASTTPAAKNSPLQLQTSFTESYRIIGLTPEDNGRNITCQVDMKQIDKNLTLSSTKQLYIEFAPKVIEKSKKIYCGINHTRTINCTVLRANPSYIRYSINGLSSAVQRRIYGDQNEFQYTFDITPTSLEHFRPFNVTANNSIGFDTCTYDLIHGGIPDPITECETYSSNVTTTITCTKSYAQGDPDGYACTLFKYNDKNNQKMFEEIARTKSCIFALENFHEPVEFRVAAFNRFGSLPVNTYGHIIRLNQPTLNARQTPFFSRRTVIIIGSVLGGLIFIIFLCCVCRCCSQDSTKSPMKDDRYRNQKYSRSNNETDVLKPTDDTIANLVQTSDEKRSHKNGTVYDVPSHVNNGRYPPQTSSTPSNSAYHQQKSNNYVDEGSISSSLNSIPVRTRLVNNKFYGHPVIDNRYGQLSPTTMVVPTSTIKRNHHEHDDEEEGDESPYSTATDLVSESGSFLVPSSSKRNGQPPPLKPRYSTLSSVRTPIENIDKTPLPKPRSRSNSRTRLNNPQTDNGSYGYEERPISSSDSGIGPSDHVSSTNGDTLRTGPVKSRQDPLQTQPIIPNTQQQQQQVRYQTLTSPIIYDTEC